MLNNIHYSAEDRCDLFKHHSLLKNLSIVYNQIKMSEREREFFNFMEHSGDTTKEC